MSGEEYGDVTVARDYDHATGTTKVRITRADPVARISIELVSEIRDTRPQWARCTEDGVLTLTDDYGQRFIYRVDLDSYDANSQSFRMEWPD